LLFVIGEYEIPAGWSIMLVPVYTQSSSDYFADPDRFHSDRFPPPWEEDKQHLYAWVGFGSEPHMCLGESTANLESKALVAHLLPCYTLKLEPNRNLSPMYVPLSRPKSDVRAMYQARQAAARQASRESADNARAVCRTLALSIHGQRLKKGGIAGCPVMEKYRALC
jgi:cytochrome P450